MSIRFNGNVGTGVGTTTNAPAAQHTVCFFLNIFATTGAFQTFWQVSDATIGNSAEIDIPAAGTTIEYSDTSGTTVGPTVPLGAWWFIALTVVPGGRFSLYAKPVGQESCTVTSGTAQATYTSTRFFLGIENGTGGIDQPTNCKMAGVRIWSGVALRQDEIERESRSVRAFRKAGLWAEFPFDSDQDLRDRTGRGVVITGTAAQLSAAELAPVPYWPRRGSAVLIAAAAAAAPTVGYWSYPDTVARPRLAAGNGFYETEAPIFPERNSPLWSVQHPDTVPPASLRLGQHFSAARSMFPERTSPMAYASYLDTVSRLSLAPFAHPQPVTATRPERTSSMATASHPDTVARPSLAIASFLAIDGAPPAPETTIVRDWAPFFPDRAGKPSLPAHEHPYSALAPFPDRTAPEATVDHPDAVARPALGAAEMLHATELQAYPERTSPIAWTTYPDAVARPVLSPWERLFHELEAVAPERTIALSGTAYPDVVARVSLPMWQSLAVTEEQPIPERSSALAGAAYPDAARRSSLPTWQHHAALAFDPLPFTSVSLFANWLPAFPDTVTPRSLASLEHLASTEVPSASDRTSPIAWVTHPDTVTRTTLPVVQWLTGTEETPAPERTTQPSATSFPDTVSRVAPFARHQTTLFVLDPIDRTSPFASTVFPDSVIRSLRQQAPFIAFTPVDRTATLVAASFPDAVSRPVHQDSAPAVATIERTAAIAAVVFPDAVARPSLSAWQHLASPDINPFQISQTFTTWWPPAYPATVSRPAPSAVGSAVVAIPERTLQMATVVYPDRVERRPLVAWQHLAVTEIAPRPERTATLAWVSYADTVQRTPPQHLTVTGINPDQITQASTFWTPSFPDVVARPSLPAPQRMSVASEPTRPESTQDASATSYPDTVARPSLSVFQHPPIARPTAPERTSYVTSTFYPDTVTRLGWRPWQSTVAHWTPGLFISPVVAYAVPHSRPDLVVATASPYVMTARSTTYTLVPTSGVTIVVARNVRFTVVPNQ